MFSELIENPSNGINIICFIVIDQDVIQVNNYNNIQSPDQNLIIIALETCRGVA